MIDSVMVFLAMPPPGMMQYSLVWLVHLQPLQVGVLLDFEVLV